MKPPSVMIDGEEQYGLTALSLLDPSAAPAGHSTLIITALLRQDDARSWFPAAGGTDWKDWHQSPEYSERKKLAGDRMIAAAEQFIPGLSRHIVYRDEASPVTFDRYDWSSAGAIYGVRKSDRFDGSKSPIAGLVLAGSATHGPGIEAAVISGAYAADAGAAASGRLQDCGVMHDNCYWRAAMISSACVPAIGRSAGSRLKGAGSPVMALSRSTV